ncbi:MAG: NADH-quinone oxidoreductase subunit NuoB [Acidobacteriota bacterium]
MKLFQKIRRVGIVTEPLPEGGLDAITIVRPIDARARRLLGRSVGIRQVDAGSCNGCELEISGLAGPTYDLERFGLHFVASPRHADLLLVTGPVTRNMEVPLRKTYEATPDPKLVVAVGDCARDCGVFAGSYAVVGNVASVVPVDVVVSGCPPSPADILRAILVAIGRLDLPVASAPPAGVSPAGQADAL